MEILRTIMMVCIGSVLLMSCNPFTESSPDTPDGDVDNDIQDMDTDITEEEAEEDITDTDPLPDGDADEEEIAEEEEQEAESDIEYPPTELLAWDGRMVLDCSPNHMLYVYRLSQGSAGLTSSMSVYNGSIESDNLMSNVPETPELRYQHLTWSSQIEREDDYTDTVITPFPTDSAGENIRSSQEVLFRRDRRTRGGGSALWGLTAITLPRVFDEQVLAFAPAPPMADWDTSDSAIMMFSWEDNFDSNLNIRLCEITVQSNGSVITTNPTCEDPQTIGLPNLELDKDYISGMLRPVGYRNFVLLNVINYIVFIDRNGTMVNFQAASPEPDMGSPDLWVESMAASPWDEGEHVDEGEFLGASLIIPEGVDKGRYICVFDLQSTDYSITVNRRSCIKRPYTEAPWYLHWHWTNYDDAYLIAASADIADKSMVIAKMGNDARADAYRGVERFSFGKPCTDAQGNIILSQPRTDGELITGTTSTESLSELYGSGTTIYRFYP